MTTGKHLACVCTFFRNEGLLDAAESFFRAANFADSDCVLVIVDSSLEGHASKTAESLRASHPKRVVYLEATEPGLVSARNEALSFARSCQALSLAFIDDDQIVSLSWYKEIRQSAAEFPNAIIAGPVLPDPAGEFPAFDPSGNFWTRKYWSDKASITEPIGDGNVLFPKHFLNSTLVYDPQYNRSGAQDTDLFLQWLDLGNEIRWSSKAIVFEGISLERLSKSWALKRAHFSSLSYVMVERKRGISHSRVIARVFKHFVIAVIYGLAAFEQKSRFRSQFHFAIMRGTLEGYLGQTVDRFAR